MTTATRKKAGRKTERATGFEPTTSKMSHERWSRNTVREGLFAKTKQTAHSI